MSATMTEVPRLIVWRLLEDIGGYVERSEIEEHTSLSSRQIAQALGELIEEKKVEDHQLGLRAIASPPALNGAGASPPPPTKPAKQPRPSREEVEAFRDEVKSYIREHPGSSGADIARALNGGGASEAAFQQRVGNVLRELGDDPEFDFDKQGNKKLWRADSPAPKSEVEKAPAPARPPRRSSKPGKPQGAGPGRRRAATPRRVRLPPLRGGGSRAGPGPQLRDGRGGGRHAGRRPPRPRHPRHGPDPSAKVIDAIRRRYTLDGDTLTYEIAMAAVGMPLTHHLRATLTRVD